MLNRVYEFNEKVVGVEPRALKTLAPSEHKWLVKCLREEATEFECSHNTVDMVDALLDSVIFSLGGLYRLGLTKEQAYKCFDAIMDANFEKKAGQKPGRVVGEVKDAVKPEGWVGPEDRISKVLYGKN